MKKFDKEKFLESEMGKGLKFCIESWTSRAEEYWKEEHHTEDENKIFHGLNMYYAGQLSVYTGYIFITYGIKYAFMQTKKYSGLFSADGTDCLFKIERGD
jgi:hypothetical protein